MPPKPRPPEAKERDKQRIINEAVVLVQERGLQGLTIRNLSARLRMSTTYIYKYFYNKDEIYLHILISGFRYLQARQAGQLAELTGPEERLRCFLRCWVDFGLEYPAFYQLMFSTRDPKPMDYTGTPVEGVARQEKAVAMRSLLQLQQLIGSCAPGLEGESLRTAAVRIVCEIHGGLNLCYSNIIRELSADPRAILDDAIDVILRHLCGRQENA